MASEESATTMPDDYEDPTDYAFNQHSNPSRLSVCTSSMKTIDDCEPDDEGDMAMYMSRLSVEEDGEDADEELSDVEKSGGKPVLLELGSSDSEKEPGCYSLPATPPRRRRRAGSMVNKVVSGGKAYASENEVEKGSSRKQRGRVKRGFYPWVWSKRREESGGNSVSGGESDQSSCGGRGVVVITRPKGGGRALCMGFEEVKACRDLGFELEHERMELPGRVSFSPTGSTLDTSSGGNSPIANWRISSPGDDPKDVKARLKTWAQAVALASTSRHGS